MKITKSQLRRLIREEKQKILESFDDEPRWDETDQDWVDQQDADNSDLDHETKATMVMEVVQQNLNDPDFVNWLFKELGMEE